KKTQKMVFFITHSVEEALFLATRLIVMSPRPGRITHSYELAFQQRFLACRDARKVKSDPDFIKMREIVFGIIYGDEKALEAAVGRGHGDRTGQTAVPALASSGIREIHSRVDRGVLQLYADGTHPHQPVPRIQRVFTRLHYRHTHRRDDGSEPLRARYL